MSRYRPGQSVRLTEDGRLATLWSEAPGVGAYWAHLEGVEEVVLIRIIHRHDSALPVVELLEEQ